MSGNDLKRLRARMGLGVLKFGRALGYEGNVNTVVRAIRRYEGMGLRDIPEKVAVRAERAAEVVRN